MTPIVAFRFFHVVSGSVTDHLPNTFLLHAPLEAQQITPVCLLRHVLGIGTCYAIPAVSQTETCALKFRLATLNSQLPTSVWPYDLRLLSM